MTHDLVIHERLVLSSRWFTYETMRASGPGGQSVNTTDSAVRLRFNLRDCDQLVPPVKQRLREAHPSACTQDGHVLLVSAAHRSQLLNREAVQRRLADWIRQALKRPKTRRPTRPTRAAKKRRVDAKKRRGKVKAGRQKVRRGTDD